MVKIYVLSQRKLRRDPAIGCLIEFEDVLLQSCAATLLIPTWRHNPGPAWLHRLRTPYRVDLPPRDVGVEEVLILTGMDWHICKALLAIPDWRSRFDVVGAYIFDAFLPQAPRHRSVSRFSRLVGSMDQVFLPMTGCVDQYQRAFEIPVNFLPYACDAMQFASNRCDRPIDVNGYGRQLAEHSRLLAKTYNHPRSPRMYYSTDHMCISEVYEFYSHRAWFWKLLQRSRLALCYDPVVTNPERFPFPFVPQRWFECLTAGCMVVGRRPACVEADQLLDWEDSTLEVPDRLEDLVPFIDDLLQDRDRLHAAHHRNYAQVLSAHDWRYRIAQLLDRLGVPRPSSLERSLGDLRVAAHASAGSVAT